VLTLRRIYRNVRAFALLRAETVSFKRSKSNAVNRLIIRITRSFASNHLSHFFSTRISSTMTNQIKGFAKVQEHLNRIISNKVDNGGRFSAHGDGGADSKKDKSVLVVKKGHFREKPCSKHFTRNGTRSTGIRIGLDFPKSEILFRESS